MRLLITVNSKIGIYYDNSEYCFIYNGKPAKYVVLIDSLCNGDPTYYYNTLTGAKIAAAKFAKKYH